MLDGYDADPVGALTLALRSLLQLPEATWPELVAAAPIDDTRRAALLVAEERALDALLSELNEVRELRPAS